MVATLGASVATAVSTSSAALSLTLTRGRLSGGLAVSALRRLSSGTSLSVLAATTASAVIAAATTSASAVATTAAALFVAGGLLLLLLRSVEGGLACVGSAVLSLAAALVLAATVVLGASVGVHLAVRDRLLVASHGLVGRGLFGKHDLEASELAADLHALEALLNRLVLVVDDDRGDLVDLVKAFNAVLHNFRNRDRLGNGFSEGGKRHRLLVVGVELFEDLVDEDASLNVSVHANDAVGDGLSLGAHLAILVHLGSVGGSGRSGRHLTLIINF
mmetsp:Transcript_19647/g.26570  ORF Transcript_19647/g.26570 Transcript_19647/m.26570 type:complete len:275 (-) Transcript_19647:7-831(-)